MQAKHKIHNSLSSLGPRRLQFITFERMHMQTYY